MKKIIASTFFLFSIGAQAQSVRYPANIYWISAGQYGPDHTTSASFAANPAAFSPSAGFSASMYAEKKFMIEGLNLLAFSAMFTRPRSAAGLQLQHFGNPGYNELQAGINYGKSLGKISIGAGVGYNSTGIAGFAKESAITLQLATVCHLTENLYTSLQMINPRIVSGNAKMQAASIYKLGFGYSHSSRAYTGFEFYKEEDRPPQVIAAVYYHFTQQFFARGGFISGTSQLFCGVGWKWKDLRLEVISSQHAILGLSPAILFTYQKHNEH